MRYDLLGIIIDITKPKNICEIGVHQGIRATQMCNRALIHTNSDQFSYEGYDLWDELNDDKEVFHGKGPSTKQNVENNLKLIKKSFNYKLIQGDTDKTLPNKTFDLVFLDGDHRDYAIQRDYDRIKGSETIVFDDYYLPEIPNIGCNNVNTEDYKCFLSLDGDFFGPNDFFSTKTEIKFLIATRNELLIDYLNINGGTK